MLSSDDSLDLKLVDFGLAIQLKEGETTSEQAGSPGYLAPEILLGKPYDKSVDMWSLGVTAYITYEKSSKEGSNKK